MPCTPLPLQPVAIALEALEFDKGSDDLTLHGIDLESGRRVRMRLEFFDHAPAHTNPLCDLVLTMSLQRVTR